MIYECLLHTENQKLVIAKLAGWHWTDSELISPFELAVTTDLVPSETEYTVDLNASWGTFTVNASQINRALVEEAVE